MITINVREQQQRIDIVSSNLDAIKLMTENNNEYLARVVNDFLESGKTITENNTSVADCARLNSLILTSWCEGDIDDSFNNVNYMKSNPDRLFFISKKSITEIHFEDTLPVSENYELISNDNTGFVIELTFKSERVRDRSKNIIGNKYRFNWLNSNNTMSVRKLTE